jgi:hypothetical protein
MAQVMIRENDDSWTFGITLAAGDVTGVTQAGEARTSGDRDFLLGIYWTAVQTRRMQAKARSICCITKVVA